MIVLVIVRRLRLKEVVEATTKHVKKRCSSGEEREQASDVHKLVVLLRFCLRDGVSVVLVVLRA